MYAGYWGIDLVMDAERLLEDRYIMNDNSRVGDFSKAILGGALIVALLIAGLICGACRNAPAGANSDPPVAGTHQPDATATATALPTVAAVTPAPTANPIRVVKVLPNTQVVSNAEYSLRNCGGNTPLRQPLSVAAQISTTVTVSEQATLSDGTTMPVPDSQLVQEVELAYQDELTAARATLDAIEMFAPPYTNWQITIIWEERSFAASVSFPSGGLTAMAAYTYTQHVPSMGYQKQMPCTA